MAHILKLKQIREGDVIGSFGRSNEVTVKSIEKDVPMLVDGTTGIRLTFHTEILPGRDWVTMGPEETLLVMNPGRRQPPAYEPPPPPQQGDKINGYCPVCNRDVSMKLGGRIPNHNSSKPGRGRGIKGNRCEGSGKTLEEAREIKAEQERKYRLLGYASVGATASVSRTGTPSPNIDVTWTEHDSWREGDPPKDPNYADRYFTFRIAHQGRSGPPVPEPINVIEAMIHDLTAFGRPEFRWEVDGTSQWGDDFGAHGTTTDLDAAKAQAAAAVQRASDEFWAKYDDSETPKGPPGGFPWDHRASKTAAASDDLAFEQDEVEASYLNARIDGVVVARIDTRSFDIRWIDGMDGRGANTLRDAKARITERLDKPSYRRLLTEAPAGVAWPKTASASDACPNCGHDLQWGPHPGEAGRFGEEIAFCPYCEWKGTEDDLRAEGAVTVTKEALGEHEFARSYVKFIPAKGAFGKNVDAAVVACKCGWETPPQSLSRGEEEAWGRAEAEFERHLTVSKTALGEQKAPPQVDTLRDEQCPVCGEVDAYSGDDCPVCGYVKPPNAFTDPDTAKAKEMDLRKDQADETKLPGDPATEDPAAGGAGQGLERFRVDGPAPAAAGASGSGLERFRVGGLNPNWARGLPKCPDCGADAWRPLGDNGALIVCRMCDRRWRPEVLKQEAAAKKRDPYAEGQRAGRGKNPHWTYWNPWPKGTPEADLYTKGWEQASGQKWAAVTAARTIPRSFDPATADTFQLAMAYEILGERARDAKTETGRSQALSLARKLEEAVRARNLHFVKPVHDSDWLCVNESEYREIVNNPARMRHNTDTLRRSTSSTVTYEIIEDDPGDLMERIAAVGADWPVIEIPGQVDVEIKAG